ncbi:MAG: hypothetical protein D8M58_19110 [Calditrichaeota bacterium]|nr:MAG: hypothetical protein DWQ03_21790 [Calditrichota bacterium]MBL1207521.1 hypothetical protein [Calditrichota bacterium]NOG47353.1 hypothetical protein [Calditrichota bacterium]
MKTTINFLQILIFLLFTTQISVAQISASYDLTPYSPLEKTDAEMRISNINLNFGIPLPLSETTFTSHEFSYNRFDMDYRNWNKAVDGNTIENATAIKYNFMVMLQMSDKWSFLGFITPGLASDFEADISTDDMTFEAVAVFIRKHSETLSMGYGLAYSRQFGEPFPLPVIAMEWNNGANLSASIILPAFAELWYKINNKFDVGFILGGDGNQYHGDPDIYGGSNPKLDFSVMNVGPSFKYHTNDWLTFNIDAGYTAFRLFEFTNRIDGKNIKEEIELDPNAFLRIGFTIGG